MQFIHKWNTAVFEWGCQLWLFETIFTFTFMHLADAFIQSDLQCIQAIHLYCQYMCSLGIEPTTFALLTQCSNHWATGTTIFVEEIQQNQTILLKSYIVCHFILTYCLLNCCVNLISHLQTPFTLSLAAFKKKVASHRQNLWWFFT